METGPNDVKRVVWAICKFFYFLSRVLLLLTSVFRYYFIYGKAETTITGPNDARRVVWAFRKFLILFLSCFIVTNECVRYYVSTGRR